MFHKVSMITLIFLLILSCGQVAQRRDLPRRDRPRRDLPRNDRAIDMYFGNWRESMPKHTHGSLVERDMLKKGNALNPPSKGAALEYTNRFTYATLDTQASTTPTTLKGEQEIFFILSGKGTIKAGNNTSDLYHGIAILMPAELEFTMKNTGDEPLTMYLISEPIPEGFRPNNEMLVKDENTIPIASTTGHWSHIVKYLFETDDGLGTLERILTVAFDPMTIGDSHSHGEGTEEVWTAYRGTSLAHLGRQIRKQPPGVGYMIPPDGRTTHSNINYSDEQIKIFYFARYRDHEVRK
ncbi:cupin domain-containing protein [Candidatus Latescibacterota bacterium]